MLRRGRRIYIVKGGTFAMQPDMWPGDELWADDFTLLGIVALNGEFIPNRAIGGNMVN